MAGVEPVVQRHKLFFWHVRPGLPFRGIYDLGHHRYTEVESWREKGSGVEHTPILSNTGLKLLSSSMGA